MVFNFFHRTEEVKSSWIDFTTNDVPEIKVGYNILIIRKKLGKNRKTKKIIYC